MSRATLDRPLHSSPHDRQQFTLPQLTSRLRHAADLLESLAAAGLLQFGPSSGQAERPAAFDQRQQRPRRTTEPASAAPAKNNATADAPLPAGQERQRAPRSQLKELRSVVLDPRNAGREAKDIAAELGVAKAWVYSVRQKARKAVAAANDTESQATSDAGEGDAASEDEGGNSDDEDEPAARHGPTDRVARLAAVAALPENIGLSHADLSRRLGCSKNTIGTARRKTVESRPLTAMSPVGLLNLPAGYTPSDPIACDAIRRHAKLTLSGIHNTTRIALPRLKAAQSELLKAQGVTRYASLNSSPPSERHLYRRMNRILKRCDHTGDEPTPEEDRFIQELIREGCRSVQAGWQANDERKRRTGLNADEKDPDEHWMPPRAMAGVN